MGKRLRDHQLSTSWVVHHIHVPKAWSIDTEEVTHADPTKYQRHIYHVKFISACRVTADLVEESGDHGDRGGQSISLAGLAYR